MPNDKTNAAHCNLSNEALSVKAESTIDELIRSGGRSWSLPVPANPNEDCDLILSELVSRFKEALAIIDEFHQLDNGPALGTYSEAHAALMQRLDKFYEND